MEIRSYSFLNARYSDICLGKTMASVAKRNPCEASSL